MSMLQLDYPVSGEALPADHGYALYSWLSRVLPALHAPDCPVAVAPIPGLYTGNGLLRVDPRRSRLRLRLLQEQIAACLPLAGKAVDIDGHTVHLGVPRVLALLPTPALVARLVVIKGFTEPGPFLDAVARQLQALGVRGEAGIPLVTAGRHAGKPRRHVLRVKGQKVVGFAVQVTGLTADESLAVQEHGLGGRRKMGCGFFSPLVPRRGDA